MHRLLGIALTLISLTVRSEADLTNSEPALDLDVPFVAEGVGAGEQTRGYTFRLDGPRTLTHLGFLSWNGTDSADADRQIGVWDSFGALVASVTVPVGGGEIEDNGDRDKFIYGELAAPVLLLAEEIYTVAVWYSVNNSPGLAMRVNFTPNSAMTYLETVETGAPGGAFAQPTIVREDRLNSYIGPNMRFDLVIPNPGFDSELRITGFELDGNIATLTWNSNPSKTYAVKWSLELESFPGDLDDRVTPDAGDSTTRSFDISDANLQLEDRWFLRVEEVPSG